MFGGIFYVLASGHTPAAGGALMPDGRDPRLYALPFSDCSLAIRRVRAGVSIINKHRFTKREGEEGKGVLFANE